MSRQLAEILTQDPLGKRRPAILCFGLSLFGAAVALRFVVSDPAEPVLLLVLLPIATLAIELEQRGGVVAAAVAVALGAWAAVENISLSVLAFLPRVGAFFLVALLVGYLFERLQWTRQAQRRLFESSLDPLIGVNLSGNVTSVNRRTLGLFGYKREEMIDHPIEEFLPGFFSELGRLAREASAHRLYELSGQTKMGGSVPLKVSIVPWESEEGVLLLSLRSESAAPLRGYAAKQCPEFA